MPEKPSMLFEVNKTVDLAGARRQPTRVVNDTATQGVEPLPASESMGFVDVSWSLPSPEDAAIMAGPLVDSEVSQARTLVFPAATGISGSSVLELNLGEWGLWVESSSYRSSIAVIDVQGGNLQSVALTAVETTQLVGCVRSQSTRQPIPGASVSLTFSFGTLRAVTDISGEFALANVPSHSILRRIQVSADGYAPEYVMCDYRDGSWSQYSFNRALAREVIGDVTAKWRAYSVDEAAASYPDYDVYIELPEGRRVTGRISGIPATEKGEVRVSGALEILPDLWRTVRGAVEFGEHGEFVVGDLSPDAAYILEARVGSSWYANILIEPAYSNLDLGLLHLDKTATIRGSLHGGDSISSVECESSLGSVDGFPPFRSNQSKVGLGSGDAFGFIGLQGAAQRLVLRDKNGSQLLDIDLEVSPGEVLELGRVGVEPLDN